MKEFKLADSVSLRLIQIFQEAMLTGIDGADLLRQVRLVSDEDDAETLVLTSAYKKQVEESYEKLLTRAQELQSTSKTKILGV